jgi:hypothetical protein
MPQVKDTVPPFINFQGERRPPCMKGGTKGLYCIYEKCNFHLLKNRKDYDSLSAFERNMGFIGQMTLTSPSMPFVAKTSPSMMPQDNTVMIRSIQRQSSSMKRSVFKRTKNTDK